MNVNEVIQHYFYGKGKITNMIDGKIYVDFPDFGQRIFKDVVNVENYLSSHTREVILDVETQPQYKTIYEAMNAALGTDHKLYLRSYTVISSKFAIWFPKLAKEKNGELYPATRDFLNILSDDYSEIKEITVHEQSEDPINIDKEPSYRIVFAWDTNNTKKYLFCGVYSIAQEESTRRCTVHKRIGTRIKLIGSPADSLEILN